MRRATRCAGCRTGCFCHFYPRSPCGERRQTGILLEGRCLFLSTLSLRRATSRSQHSKSWQYYFYPRSPCGERLAVLVPIILKTHNFYPRSPCGERLGVVSQDCVDALFLSTLSLRRATRLQSRTYQAKDDFYPRSPCGERQGVSTMDNGVTQISIHALLAESDLKQFVVGDVMGISIHALLAESDPITPGITHYQGHFYPRSPCGERHLTNYHFTLLFIFLSTLSLRRATLTNYHFTLLFIFLSTLSLRRATNSPRATMHTWKISIHALLAESDY